jgi:citrate/tricarballylate utilization protein
MLPAELLEEGQHLMTVCNACRYCEGFCAVWKAMETRTVFQENDLNYLSNLCHNCSECYYSCQYSPPHLFNINPPKTLAKLRVYSYEVYAWPSPLAKAFHKNGLVVSLLTAVILIAFMGAASVLLGGRLFQPVHDGNFYKIIPHRVMSVTFAVVGGFAALALLMGFLRFWRNVDEPYATLINPRAIYQAAKDILTLKNLDNDGDGCSLPTESSSETFRWLHHLTFYGFLSCFVATTLGAIDYFILGQHGPPGFTSLPVIFGTVGGIGLIVGPIGLLVLMKLRNREIADESQAGMDLAFILLLVLIAVTGLLLLTLRQSAAMGTLLIIHLGFVMTLFLTIPYGKFVHGVYRSGALLKWALERSRQPAVKAKL